jgi:predicted SAM-dependent methyltransferase
MKGLWRYWGGARTSSPASGLANLGCGAHYHAGWDNYDYAPAAATVRSIDLGARLPFASSAYEAIYLSHVLEHLPRQRVPSLLAEVFNCLQVRGVVRIVVPNLEEIARRYLAELEAAAAGDAQASDRHEWMTMELLDQLVRQFSGGFMGRMMALAPRSLHSFIRERMGKESDGWLGSGCKENNSDMDTASWSELIYQRSFVRPKVESDFRRSGEIHRWMYDRVSLARLMRNAGFSHIMVCGPTQSSIPNFASYHLDTDEQDVVRKPDSLFIEAIKPTSAI